MPKITYVPLDRLDPMYSETPTRYSPRPLPKSETAQASSDKNNEARQTESSDRRNEANKNRP
jgi:hypothetical protein